MSHDDEYEDDEAMDHAREAARMHRMTRYALTGGQDGGLTEEEIEEDEREALCNLLKREGAELVYEALSEELLAIDAGELAALLRHATEENLPGDETRAGRIVLDAVRRYCVKVAKSRRIIA